MIPFDQKTHDLATRMMAEMPSCHPVGVILEHFFPSWGCPFLGSFYPSTGHSRVPVDDPLEWPLLGWNGPVKWEPGRGEE